MKQVVGSIAKCVMKIKDKYMSCVNLLNAKISTNLEPFMLRLLLKHLNVSITGRIAHKKLLTKQCFLRGSGGVFNVSNERTLTFPETVDISG